MLNEISYLLFGLGLALVALSNGLMAHATNKAISWSSEIIPKIGAIFFTSLLISETAAIYQILLFFTKAKSSILIVGVSNLCLGLCGFSAYLVLRGFVNAIARNPKASEATVFCMVPLAGIELMQIIILIMNLRGV